MATYLFIHGAWHGQWAWKYIYSLFPKKHTVITLDLPGHGENLAAYKDINLKTYVDCVIDRISSLPEKVILVGHSMAGMVISQVAELVPARIERLSYVAAFVPASGENVLDIGQKFGQTGISTEMIWNRGDYLIDLKRSPLLKDLFFNTCSEDLAHKAIQLLAAEPMQPFLDPVHLSQEKFGTVEKQYIECLKDKTISIEDQRKMQGKIVCSIDSIQNADHSPFYSTPQELIDALL